MTPTNSAVDWETLNFHSDRHRPFLEIDICTLKMDSTHCNNTLLPLSSTGVNLIWKLKMKSLSFFDLPEVFRLKLMGLNTNYNGLLPVNCFSINLNQIKTDNWMICNVQWSTWRLQGRASEWSYSANSTGIVLLDVGPQLRITGVSPRPESCLTLMGLRVAHLLSEVVKLEGDLVVWVKEAAITQVSMLRY